MASQGTPSPLSPAPSLTSQSHEQSHESPVQHVSIIGKAGLTYQPNIYHSHLYPQFDVPYSCSVRPVVQAVSAPAGPASSNAPIPKPVPGERPRKAARKGRVRGSQNWTKQDLKALAQYVKGAPRLRRDVWKQIEGRYNNEYALPNERQERKWDNMRDKWNSLKSVGKMPVVDPEDHPGVEGTRRDGSGKNNIDGADHITLAKNTFATSRPGTDPDWDGGNVSGGDSTAWQTENGSASPSLAEMLLSSFSPDAEARQNHNGAVMHLYLQRIRAQEDTIRELELKNYALQDQLYSAVRKLNTEERRADKLERRLEMSEMMRTYRRRLSRHHRANHQRSLSESSCSGSNRSSSSDSPSSRSPSRSVLKSKRRRVDLQAAEEGKGVFQDKEDEALVT